jgi:glycine/D-amino acid oxidase-like deaminating enzyme
VLPELSQGGAEGAEEHEERADDEEPDAEGLVALQGLEEEDRADEEGEISDEADGEVDPRELVDGFLEQVFGGHA